MKPTTILVSALATLAAAAPTEKKVEERSFNFDVNSFNNFNGFQSVNLNYLAKLNGLDLNILSLLAANNNFNIGGFQNLFAVGQNQFDIQSILLLQQLVDLQQFFNAGILNNFNLASFQFGGLAGLGVGGSILDTGLLNLGGVNLGSFVSPNVVTQVQTVAQSFVVVKE